ncbi:MAG: TIGR03667 family PPOX class F420-dependent oxidoreductase [Chloroflexota bacterium]
MIDFSTSLGKRVAEQLKDEQVIWLTTVGPDNTPQPRPVWFLWDGISLLVYSKPNAHKINHIMKNPKIALNFNSDFDGDEVSVMLGEARLDASVPPAIEHEIYIEKYDTGIEELGATPQSFSDEYATQILITPTKLRGF